MAKILCPICDEELGNCIDDVPDKCPICDTRKHEILLELKAKESGRLSFMESSIPTKNSTNTNTTIPNPVIETESGQGVVNEPADEVIFADVPVRPAAELLGDEDALQFISEAPIITENIVTENPVTSNENQSPANSTEPAPTEPAPTDVSINTMPLTTTQEKESATVQDSQKSVSEPQNNLANVNAENSVPNPSLSSNMSSSKQILPLNRSEESTSLANKKNLVVTPIEDEEASENAEGSSMMFIPQKKPTTQGPCKSGASCLEMLPGYRLCPKCGSAFAKDYTQPCSCGNTTLNIIEKQFAPGHYLILYNHQRKAIAYFRLSLEGSIFIGRSSERGSDRDIDLSIAWKHFYYRHTTNEAEFKEQMRLLKGISRKHALIRYDKESQKFVLFHLSDKNYTVAEMPSGEKRPRSPNNRNRIELQSNTLISIGNQKDYIVLRYKEITVGNPQ